MAAPDSVALPGATLRPGATVRPTTARGLDDSRRSLTNRAATLTSHPVLRSVLRECLRRGERVERLAQELDLPVLRDEAPGVVLSIDLPRRRHERLHVVLPEGLIGGLDPDADVLEAKVRHLREQTAEELLDRGGSLRARVHRWQLDHTVLGKQRRSGGWVLDLSQVGLQQLGSVLHDRPPSDLRDAAVDEQLDAVDEARVLGR